MCINIIVVLSCNDCCNGKQQCTTCAIELLFTLNNKEILSVTQKYFNGELMSPSIIRRTWVSLKVFNIFVRFWTNLEYLDRCPQKFQISNAVDIRPVRTALIVRDGGQIDGHDQVFWLFPRIVRKRLKDLIEICKFRRLM